MSLGDVKPQKLSPDLTEPDLRKIVSFAESTARGWKKISVSQVRKIYTEIARIRGRYKRKDVPVGDILNSLTMLRPRLAYAYGRARESRDKEFREKFAEFYSVYDSAIKQVVNAPAEKQTEFLERFFALAESLVAYHKLSGARETAA